MESPNSGKMDHGVKASDSDVACANYSQPHVSNIISQMINISETEDTFSSRGDGEVETEVIDGTGTKCHVCTVCQKIFYKPYLLRVHMVSHTNLKPYECDICHKTFRHPSSLSIHKKMHANDGLVTCEICERSFTNSSQLQHHMQNHIVQPTRVENGMSSSSEKTELVTHSNETEISSSSETFADDDYTNASRRVENSDKKKQFMCDVCRKFLSSSSNLNKHKKVHTRVKNMCTLCGMTFPFTTQFDIHMRQHKGLKNQECEVCGKMFLEPGKLRIHMRVHNGDKPYVCDLCGNAFSQSGSLKFHRLKHTGESPYKCNICDKVFRTPTRLKEHERLHTGEKPFCCEICSKNFRTSKMLRSHMLTHEKERRMSLDDSVSGLCRSEEAAGSRSRSSSDVFVMESSKNTSSDSTDESQTSASDSQMSCGLAVDMKGAADQRQTSWDDMDNGTLGSEESTSTLENTGDKFVEKSMSRPSDRPNVISQGPEKIWTCDICGRGFRYLSYLERHKQVQHSDSRKYYCKPCDRIFKSLMAFHGHKSFHTGEGKTSCEVCGIEFSNSRSLNNHRRVHTKEEYTCGMCEKGFAEVGELLQHMEEHGSSS